MKALLLALVLVTGSVSAAETGTGSFKSKDLGMTIRSAMAFPGTSLLDKTPVIIVAVTSGEMDTDALAAYHDRRRAIDRRVKDNDTGVVYFEFKPDGSYRGYSFYFASGNGCGYCGGSMGIASTVKVANGRVTGSLKGTDTNRSFDIALDIPVRSADHGTPLPPDGGAPGKAYMDYHDALVKRDAKALHQVLSEEVRKIHAGATKEGKAVAYMDFLASDHPTRTVKITRGWSAGNTAVVLFDGESGTLKLTGEAVLLKQDGTWRVDDELTDVVMR